MITELKSVISEYAVRNKKDEDIPVYSVTNEHGFCTGYFSKDVSSKDRTNYKIVPYGCFAYNPSRINVGSVDWQHCQERVIVSPLYVVFKVNESLIDRRYLLHYLKSDVALTMIKAKASGSVRDNLKFSILQEFQINLRSIEEQKKIADALDRVSSLIARRREQLAGLDALVKARFVEMFGDPVSNPLGWETYTFDDCFDITSSKRILKSEWKAEGIPFLRVRDMVQLAETGKLANEFYVSEEFYSTLKDSDGVPREADILVSATSTLGKCYVVPKTERYYFKDADVLRFRSKTNVNPIYFVELMKTDYIGEQISKTLGVTTVAHFTIKAAKTIKMRVPPIALQKQFADFVSRVDRTREAVQAGLAELETLKRSLMQTYFG